MPYSALSYLKTALIAAALTFNLAYARSVTELTPLRANGDIAVDVDGALYVADYGDPTAPGGNSIMRVAADGSVSTFASGLSTAPAGLAFDSHGNLIVATFLGGDVYRIDQQGTATVIAEIPSPVGVTVARRDVVYVASCGLNAIYQIDADGTTSQIAQGGDLSCPNGIAVGHDGALYTVNDADGLMLRVDVEGNIERFAELPGSGSGFIEYIDERYYVAGRDKHEVYQIDTSGLMYLLAGRNANPHLAGGPEKTSLANPNGIGISPDGRFLFVTGAGYLSYEASPLRRVRLWQRPELAWLAPSEMPN